ncbi:YxcD family protein [Brevibacillus sp. B_LB10_24]|uniref:YxcD family protein n=1 Tax=Brevibacillus sp. B_LB10_24 TaxID=3380645 RepID=UPI0038B8D835
METIRLSEQELVNAICLYVADKRQIQPEEVTVELVWDDEYGFSAEVYVAGRQQVLVEANLLEAIRLWLQTQLNRNPYSAALELVLDDDEGIIALAKYSA